MVSFGSFVQNSFANNDGHHESHDSGISQLIVVERMEKPIHEVVAALEEEGKNTVLSITLDENENIFGFDKPDHKLISFVNEGGTVYEIELNSATGSESSRKRARFWSTWGEDWGELQQHDFQMTVAEIVKKVEETYNSKVVGVELDKEDGLYLYQVAAISREGRKNVLVDPVTGNVYPISSRHEQHED